MGDVIGLVPDERPISPNQLTEELNNVGFSNSSLKGLSLGHQRFPPFLRAILLLFDYPFRNLWPLKFLCSYIAWYCEKPKN